MKKLLIGGAVAAMMLSPVTAKAGDDWVGPAIAGTIFGIIIGNSGHHHSEVIIERPRHRHGYRRYPRRHPRHVWVEVCKTWPYTYRDHYGDYFTEMHYECRMMKKARW